MKIKTDNIRREPELQTIQLKGKPENSKFKCGYDVLVNVNRK